SLVNFNVWQPNLVDRLDMMSQMESFGRIDRIENNIATIILDGRENELYIKLEDLPEESREGSVLLIQKEKSSYIFTLVREETERSYIYSLQLLKKALKK